MNFSQLHERLRIELLHRIERGFLTAALLARQTGLQPPHISNFLRNKRRLSLPALDRVLAALGLSAADLLPPPASPLQQPSLGIPLVSQHSAIHQDSMRSTLILGRVHLPPLILDTVRVEHGARRPARERFVAIVLTPAQAAPMSPILRPSAIAVLDRHATLPASSNTPARSIYAVLLSAELQFCYLSYERNLLLLRPHSLDYPVHLLPIPPQASPSDFIIGRLAAILSNL